MKIQDKIVVVTGSSSGIGKATAIRFAREGAKVVINSSRSKEAGEAVAAKIRDFGGEAIYVQADVSKPSEVRDLFDRAIEVFGGVDILINNAGRTVGQPFGEMKKQHWEEMFAINLFSAVLCSQEAAKNMLKRGGGVILNTSSIRGLYYGGREGIMAYSAAKAALINFTKTLAKELAPTIRVNAILPGFVYTPPYDNFPQQLKEDFVASTAIKRFITPDEIADGFVFLACNDAITGTALLIDGGFSLKFA